jgi:RNA polymerase sigma-70 factor, ECF subfamily
MADRLPHEVVERTFRAESGRALATLARLTGDLDVAEDAVQEAFVAAMRTWPAAGIPDRPGAWITTTARNHARDRFRREARRGPTERAAVQEALERSEPVLHPVADDQLRLMFTCCHPSLAAPARVALTLRLVSGLSVPEIARVLLVGSEAVAKRIQRAKDKIRHAGIPLRVPPPGQLDDRLPSVLECIYLTFTEGYAATGGDALIRHELCDEAVRLARLLTELLPDDPGAEGLLALVLLQDSRRAARLDGDGHLVVLADQDRDLWDRDRMAEGRAWVDRARRHREVSRGAVSYLLQATIAAEHARATSWEATDWPAIVVAYDRLLDLTGSPVVALNRAVAVSFADGPATAITDLDALACDPRVAASHRFHTARADVYRRAGHHEEARIAYQQALALVGTDPERSHIKTQLRSLESSAPEAGLPPRSAGADPCYGGG